MNLNKLRKQDLIELVIKLDDENTQLTNQYNELAWIAESLDSQRQQAIAVQKEAIERSVKAVKEAQESSVALHNLVASLSKASKYDKQIKEPSDINKLIKHIKSKFKRWGRSGT
ncbi:hypothetical protein [Vibrio lentus]|uniref:hypothetical protein n=1 Tax=Vibrio lentus TaxID=136468 RepID=UPI0010BCF1C7|nr:hypothetical protein [Vibrio lentus]TKG17735.1 hypothetical protein FCW05_12575 [Vibrio lentus]